jgi:regulator of RNase E activity RraA
LFAGSVSVSHAYVHIIEFGTPVEIGGLKIESGDLLHGDLHGVQSIPLGIADRIPRVAAEIIAKEQELITLCQSKDFSVEKLRAAIAGDQS